MATPTLVLVVDDRPAEQVTLARLLQEAGYHVLFAEGYDEPAAAPRSDIAFVVCRWRIGTSNGMEFVRRWRAQGDDSSLVVLLNGDANAAREAIKAGATACLREPLDPDELRVWIDRCRAANNQRRQIRDSQARLDARFGFVHLIGQSNAMQQLVGQARTAAETDVAIVVSGEPGTGKALVAETIHQNSARRGGPFVDFDVTALSVRQVEQELFGTLGGLTLESVDARPGRLGRAAGGTLFIDDVAELAAVTQARLLRAIEPGGSDPLGIVLPRAVDVRVIAATARKLDALAAEGRFSPGLFRRLSGFQLRLPPLRERREDIPLLIDHFLRRACERLARPVPTCEPELLRFLERFDWPENVRQLRLCLESMLALSRPDVLTLDDLPADLDDPTRGPPGLYLPPGATLAELERAAVEHALAHCGGNRTRAAEQLGISVRTLQRKLKTWSYEGIDLDAATPLRQEH